MVTVLSSVLSRLALLPLHDQSQHATSDFRNIIFLKNPRNKIFSISTRKIKCHVIEFRKEYAGYIHQVLIFYILEKN